MTPLTAREAARLLGGEAVGRDRVLCPGPGHSGRDRSLSVRLGAGGEGFMVHSFAGDPVEACRDHVRDRLGLEPFRPLSRRPNAPTLVTRPPAPREEISRSEAALRIWRRAIDPAGTPVEAHLERRCLPPLPPGVSGRAIRWSGHRGDVDGAAGCMVALFRDAKSDRPVAVHRTFLASDGRKLARKMLGPVKGAAIKLVPDDEVTLSLTLAEGIETGLAAMVFGYRNVWVLGDAGAIGDFPMLLGLEAITALGERNPDGSFNAASASAIEKLASRCNEAGIEILAVDAPAGGDLNDALRRRAAGVAA